MEPNRHHEYQTHHPPPPPHQLHSHHHQQQQYQHHPHPPTQPHVHQHQSVALGGSTSSSSSSSNNNNSNSITSYNTHHGGAAEQDRNRTMYLMGGRGGPAASALPPAGAALIGGGTGAPLDPHCQYYTSNMDLPIKKQSSATSGLESQPHTQHPAPPSSSSASSSSSWREYKTQAPVPAPRHHSNPMYNHSAPAPQPLPPHSTAYWPPEDHHQHPRSSYSYTKPHTLAPPAISTQRPSAISSSSSSGSGNSQRNYYDDGKYSVPAMGKGPGYAPAAPAPTAAPLGQPSARHLSYEIMEHAAVNPSNALVAPGEQQPSPNYGRKCPQHYEPPERSAAAPQPQPAPPTSAAANTPSHHHHQSLYMPMPQFSTEKFQTTVHNAIEKYVRESSSVPAPPPPSLDYRRPMQPTASSYGRSYYGQQTHHQTHAKTSASPAHYSPYGGTPSAGKAAPAPPVASYVKLEPEHSLPPRPGLYHHPYGSQTHSSEGSGVAGCCKEATPATPHGYPTKYGKLLQQHGEGAQTPPPPLPPPTRVATSSAPSSAYYYHSSPSPAAATVASPTPQLYTHTPPPPSTSSASSGSANYSTLQVYPHGPDICCQPKPPSIAASQVVKQTPPPPSSLMGPAAGPGPATAKKTSQSVKPNYRALINDMLKRNTASEEELNLQIIKKTLNMETPAPARVISAPLPSAPAPAPVPAPVIQQLPAAAHSPLDLSMRTVKQTADSTEYKYQRPQVAPSSAGGGAGLPRFDITPNFSAATRGTPPLPAPAPTQAPVGNATAVIRTAPSSYTSQPPAAPALVIKSVQQLRPSVVETNPYAKRQILACDQLPPETSILALPKPSGPPATAPTPPTPPSPHNSSNPNYLGRKRHLQEYNQAAAAAKQARCEASSLPPTIRAAEIPVIAVNEQALAAKRAEMELQQSSSSSSGGIIVMPPVICKQEPLTPTTPTMPTIGGPGEGMPPKVEQRIRTKAELKGFTFTPPVLAAASSTTTPPPPVTPPMQPKVVTNNIQIKLEPAPQPLTPPDLGLDESFNSNLLDWGNACNNLVEQLLTKVVLPKSLPTPPPAAPPQAPAAAAPAVEPVPHSPPMPTSSIKLELSEDDLPVARILKRKPIPDVESAATTTSVGGAQLTATTTATNPNGVLLQQKKLSKTEREKKRLVQEQRIAARLAPAAGQSSSSESDTTELHKRKTERQKKPLMRKGKGRRPAANNSKEKPADTKSETKIKREQKDTDDEEEEEEEDDEEEEKEQSEDKNKSKGKKAASKTKTQTNHVQYKNNNKKGENNHRGRPKTKTKESPEERSTSNSSSDTSSSSSSNDDEEDEETRTRGRAKTKPANKGKPIPSSKRPTRPTLKARIALNTMTRSKRKKELELQLANSKVLRNDKIIRNSTTKIKRKYVRKMVAAQQTAADKKEMMCTRLRTKRSTGEQLTAQLNGRKMKTGKNSTAGTITSPQQQLFLEEYRYKLALKIPHRLISINKLNSTTSSHQHKLPAVAASLPDLERRDLSQELACFKTVGSNRGRKPKAKPKPETSMSMPKSIIDVLHLRVTNGGNQLTSLSNSTTKSLPPPSSLLSNYSETSQTSASNSLYEQPHEPNPASLPPPTVSTAPTAPAAANEGPDSASKRHFSIFDTKVLQSKTRTESKLQQRREIIREIFVGPERPASAPPCEGALSYQQYEEILEQMDRIVSANNNKFSRRSTPVEDQLEKMPPATTHHGPHKRKYLRRKGSSGFDYIRKKKRPNHQANNQASSSTTNSLAQNNTSANEQSALNASLAAAAAAATADERLEDTDSTIVGSSHLPAKVKTVADVCREIQKWVLNKGVGQSTMHKAARQGLIDVVVYCLDHMNMNPDQKDNAGYTPLHEACTQGWLEIARILLQFGANHSEAAQSGIRPLHGAIENDHEEVVRLLLSYGADPLLATYSGQTPLMLASSKLMRSILRAHLSDAQSAAADIKPMRFQGPWEIFDAKEYGYDIFDNVPNTVCDMSRALRRKERNVLKKRRKRPKDITNKAQNNGLVNKKPSLMGGNESAKVETIKQNGETSAKTATTASTTTTTTALMKMEESKTRVKLEQIEDDEDSNNNKNNNSNNDDQATQTETQTTTTTNLKRELKDVVNCGDKAKFETNIINHCEDDENEMNDEDDNDEEDEEDDEENGDGEQNAKADDLNGDIFEFEEADVLLPPLYLLKDEGSDKWVLLNDLCNLLKVKSKDTLLNKICPNNNSMANTQKQLLREFKMSDFLEKATCLQLLCAGEKLNMGASKVVLIKYNESVKNLLGVKTILMKF